MGTKRRKGGELPTASSGVSSLSHAATERPPPAKAPRTAAASAPPSSVRRFGFKGPSISQLPTAAAKSLPRPTAGDSLVVATHGDAPLTGRVTAEPIELDIHVLDKFHASFGQETLATLEQLLAFRHKTNKFAVKARKEEQISYIKQLKAGVRDVVAKVGRGGINRRKEGRRC
jgi:hypothetical protein